MAGEAGTGAVAASRGVPGVSGRGGPPAPHPRALGTPAQPAPRFRVGPQKRLKPPRLRSFVSAVPEERV